jgi:hypothetical protein
MTPCREWQKHRGHHGYGQKWDRERKKVVAVHRWVMAQITGWEAIEGKVVMHLCDNPACFRFDHLQVGTQADNNRDRDSKGRTNPSKKLSADQVREIKQRLGTTTPLELAAEFGVTRNTIYHIKNGWHWSHV